MNVPRLIDVRRLLIAIIGAWLFVWTPAQMSGSQFLDPFTPVDLGVGGDQHECGTGSFFTNIVASAVGDLDGDDNADIVLLSNAVPPNGAYKAVGTTYPEFNSFRFRGDWNFYYSGFTFLKSGDRLFGEDDGTLPGGINFNQVDTPQPWFTANFFSTLNAGVQTRVGTLHFAPPSPNVVMGMVNSPTYTGSEVAWLRGDGRGNFNLMFVTPFGPDGVTPSPVRIRLGFEIILAKMRDPAQRMLDIVLASANDLAKDYTWNQNSYYPANTSSIEPFTGAGRVFWLENKGWNGAGTNLEFVDHNIAEYNQDRIPTAFYQRGNQWDEPAGSLHPMDIDVRDIDGDRRLDVLVMSDSPNGLHSVGPDTYSGNPDAATLNNQYSPKLRRPQIGEKWWAINFTNPTRLFWYKNELIAGQPHLSTDTFNNAFNVSGSPIGDPWRKLAFLRLGGGQEAVATLWPKFVYRREVPYNLSSPLKLLNRSRDLALSNEFYDIRAADMNADGIDELLYDEFDCLVPEGCTARTYIHTVTASGTSDVTVTEVARIAHPTDNYKRHSAPPMAIADFNRDNFNDFVIGTSWKEVDPINVFLSGGAGAAFDYRRLKQQSPNIGNVITANGYLGNGTMDEPLSFVSVGDFNRDGYPDIVRTGPSLPATLFINDIGGLQRAVVTATSRHATGTHNTWIRILNGEIPAGGGGQVLISTTPIAQVMDTP